MCMIKAEKIYETYAKIHGEMSNLAVLREERTLNINNVFIKQDHLSVYHIFCIRQDERPKVKHCILNF